MGLGSARVPGAPWQLRFVETLIRPVRQEGWGWAIPLALVLPSRPALLEHYFRVGVYPFTTAAGQG